MMIVEHLLSISNRMQPYLDYFCIGSFGLAIPFLRYTKIANNILCSRIVWCLVIGLAPAAVGLYLAQIATYAIFPNYSDHFESTVASIGWLGLHGRALYPDWVTSDVYGMLYGPILYLLNGLFLLAMPTLTMSKISGIASLVIAFAALFWVLNQKTRNAVISFLIIASLVTVFDRFGVFGFSNRLGVFTYWNRAEPFLILITVLALVAEITLQPFVAAVVIGGLAGAATGLKIHGFLYVLPIAMMLLGRVKNFRDRAVLSAVGAAGAILFGILPFCMRAASFENYLLYLRLAAHHGLSLELLKENCVFAVAMIAPMASIWYLQRSTLNAPERWFVSSLIVSIALVAIIAAKPGAGAYHFFPFAPQCFYGVSLLLARSRADARRGMTIVFTLLLVVYCPSLFLQIQQMRSYQHNAHIEQAKIAELRELLDAYPGAQIGVSDETHYADTYYKFLSVVSGHPLRVDFAAWMDMQYSGVEESNILRFVKGCEVPEWILPLGPPFTMVTWYTQLPLLSDEFRRTFGENYKLAKVGNAYQVWECRVSMKQMGSLDPSEMPLVGEARSR
jgi:hypothetical protein